MRTKGHINQEKQEVKPSATRERCSRKWPTEEKERGEAGEARRRALSQDRHQHPAAVWCYSRTPGTLQLKCTGQGMMWLPLPSGCAVGSRLGQRGKKPGRHGQARKTLSCALAGTTQGTSRDRGAGVVMPIHPASCP